MSYYPTRRLCDVGVTLLDCEHRTPKASLVGYPYIAIPNIKEGRLDLSEVRLISKDDFDSWTKKTKPQAGNIIVTRRARVGDTAVVPPGLGRAKTEKIQEKGMGCKSQLLGIGMIIGWISSTHIASKIELCISDMN